MAVNSSGEMEIVDVENAVSNESKLYIQDGTEHLIIDGQQISFAEAASDEENEGEVIDEIDQVVGAQVIEEDESGNFLVGVRFVLLLCCLTFYNLKLDTSLKYNPSRRYFFLWIEVAVLFQLIVFHCSLFYATIFLVRFLFLFCCEFHFNHYRVLLDFEV